MNTFSMFKFIFIFLVFVFVGCSDKPNPIHQKYETLAIIIAMKPHSSPEYEKANLKLEEARSEIDIQMKTAYALRDLTAANNMLDSVIKTLSQESTDNYRYYLITRLEEKVEFHDKLLRRVDDIVSKELYKKQLLEEIKQEGNCK